MSIWSWLGRLFHGLKTDVAKVAVAITEGVQSALKSGVLPVIADVIDITFHTHLGEDIVKQLNTFVPKILAVELGLEGLPDNPTTEEITAFADKVSTAISGKDLTGKSKVWTTLSAQIALMIKNQVDAGTPLTWAQLVSDIEDAYQDYKADLAAANEAL